MKNTLQNYYTTYILYYIRDGVSNLHRYLCSIFLLEGRDIHYFIPFLMIRIFLHKEINPAIIYHI